MSHSLYTLLKLYKEDDYQFSIALDDGAHKWFPETLLEALNESYDEKSNENELDLPVYADDRGIWECERMCGERVRLLYSIIQGRWNDEGNFEEGEE